MGYNTNFELEGNVEDFKKLYESIDKKIIIKAIESKDEEITDYTWWAILFLLDKFFNKKDNANINDIIKLGEYKEQYKYAEAYIQMIDKSIIVNVSLTSNTLEYCRDLLDLAGKISKTFVGELSGDSSCGEEYYILKDGEIKEQQDDESNEVDTEIINKTGDSITNFLLKGKTEAFENFYKALGKEKINRVIKNKHITDYIEWIIIVLLSKFFNSKIESGEFLKLKDYAKEFQNQNVINILEEAYIQKNYADTITIFISSKFQIYEKCKETLKKMSECDEEFTGSSYHISSKGEGLMELTRQHKIIEEFTDEITLQEINKATKKRNSEWHYFDEAFGIVKNTKKYNRTIQKLYYSEYNEGVKEGQKLIAKRKKAYKKDNKFMYDKSLEFFNEKGIPVGYISGEIYDKDLSYLVDNCLVEITGEFIRYIKDEKDNTMAEIKLFLRII